MTLINILILALVQGFCELLPVSSSAHVIVAEKLMGLDPSAPAMTLLLVALHTGTMFAVIAYFWRNWKTTYFSSALAFRRNAGRALAATLLTGVVGLSMLRLIPLVLGLDRASFEIEQLFANMQLIALALGAAGVLILIAGLKPHNAHRQPVIHPVPAMIVGAVQGLCLPFRGFSRSGATISTALLMGVSKAMAEEFSFALAVILTPAVIAKELHRFLKAAAAAGLDHTQILHLAMPSLLGMGLSFLAGLVALRWLSSWLEQGRWHLFGIYCLAAAGAIMAFMV